MTVTFYVKCKYKINSIILNILDNDVYIRPHIFVQDSIKNVQANKIVITIFNIILRIVIIFNLSGIEILNVNKLH